MLITPRRLGRQGARCKPLLYGHGRGTTVVVGDEHALRLGDDAPVGRDPVLEVEVFVPTREQRVCTSTSSPLRSSERKSISTRARMKAPRPPSTPIRASSR